MLGPAEAIVAGSFSTAPSGFMPSRAWNSAIGASGSLRIVRLPRRCRAGPVCGPALPPALLGLCVAGGRLGSTAAGITALRRDDEARRQAGIVQAVARFLSDDLLAGGGAASAGSAEQTLVDAARRADDRIDLRFAGELLVAGSIHAALARSFALRSADEPARLAFERAERDFDRAGRSGRTDAAVARLQQASAEAQSMQTGSLDRAGALVERVRPDLSAGRGPPGVEAVWLDWASDMIQLMGGDLRLALRLFQRAADRADVLPQGLDADQRLTLHRLQALALIRLGRFDEAERALQGLLPAALRLHGPHHPGTLMVELNLAQVLLACGDASHAADALDRITPEFQAYFGPTHRLTLQLIEQQEIALDQLQRYDQAAVAKAGEGSFFAAGALSDLADIQCRAGHVDAGNRVGAARLPLRRRRPRGEERRHGGAEGNRRLLPGCGRPVRGRGGAAEGHRPQVGGRVHGRLQLRCRDRPGGGRDRPGSRKRVPCPGTAAAADPLVPVGRRRPVLPALDRQSGGVAAGLRPCRTRRAVIPPGRPLSRSGRPGPASRHGRRPGDTPR